jgi:hypothetical protein
VQAELGDPRDDRLGRLDEAGCHVLHPPAQQLRRRGDRHRGELELGPLAVVEAAGAGLIVVAVPHRHAFRAAFAGHTGTMPSSYRTTVAGPTR